jgi:hypothetical protein
MAEMTENRQPVPAKSGDTYETHVSGIRIVPGQWRPHYHWEQIAWISPPWPSQDYLWLDFPEAIFTDQGLMYLSAVNPAFSTVFSDLPKVPWEERAGGIGFERKLPNGIRFGGSVTRHGEKAVDLELHIANRSEEPMTGITLQTCAYLRAIKEFAEFTTENKFVHIASRGWVSFAEAVALPEIEAPYRVGWRTRGKRMADLPVMVTVSSEAERFVAMTWGTSTLSMVSNPGHPCMHADPYFPALDPGEHASIRGKILFSEGLVSDFPGIDFVG